MWTQTSFDTNLDPAAHTSGVKVQPNGSAYPANWPTDDNGNPQGWEGHTWRWRPYSEIDPSNINAVAGFAPSRAYNVATPGVILLPGDGADLVRSSHWMDVPEGQYDFRIKRNTGEAGDTRTVLASTLLQLKAIQPDSADYTGQKRMAVRIKASSQLNGTLDNVSAIATAKIPVWNGSSWVTQATLNPAWWFLWFARGAFDAAGRRLYGAGMADSKIDIDKIIRWAAYCTTNGFTIRKVLDKSATASAVLDAIAQCGFASKGWPNGKLSLVWTEKDQPAVCLFTPDNIKRGSFEIDWLGGDDLAEEIVVNYIDPATWETASVRQLIPGVTSPKNSTTVDFDGCADESMAGKYANLKAASQVLHRRAISWDADIEGLMVRRGDIALMSHDMTQWAYAGRLLSGSHQSITLDKPVPQSALGGWVTLRSPAGRIFTQRVAAGSGETSALTFVTTIPAEDGEGVYEMPSDGGNPLDWVWCYDPQSSVPGMRLLVTHVTPSDYNTVRITAVDDAEAYYDSISNAYEVLTAPQLAVQSYRVLTAAVYTGNYDAAIGKYLVTCTWTMDRQCNVRVDCAVNEDSVSASVGVGTAAVWARAGDVVKFTISPTPDAFTSVYPRWVQATVTGINVPLPDVTGLRVESEFSGKEFSVAWDAVENATGYIGEVWAGGVKRRNVDFGNVLRYAYTLDEAKADGGPYRTVTIKVKSVGVAGQSMNWAAITASNPAPAAPTGLRARVGFGSISVSWDPPLDLDVSGYLVHISTSPGFTPTASNRVSDDTALSALVTRTANAGVLEVGTAYYIKVAAYDLFGRESLNYSGEVSVTMTAIPAALLELQNLGPDNFTPATAEAIANMQSLANADLDALAQIDTALLASMSSELQAARDAVQQQALTILNGMIAQDAEAGKRREAAAAIVRETNTRISELQAVAEDILALVARMGTAEAGIVSANQTRATADTALAQQINTLTSTVSGNKAAADLSVSSLATADTALGQRIDSLTSAVNTDRTSTAASISAESTARSNADASIAGQVTSLSATVVANKTAADQAVSINSAAISAEQQARASADRALSGRIDTLTATVSGNKTSGDAAITTEQQARATADTALSGQVTSLSATVAANKTAADQAAATNSAAITTEQQARASADSALSGRIDTLTATVSGNKTSGDAAITTEQQARATADTALSGQVTSLSATVAANKTAADQAAATNSAAITTEQQARASADSALSGRIDTLTATVSGNKTSGDAAITTEQQARATADTALSGQVTSLSATVAANKTAADQAAATNSAAITTEQQARATADTALSQQISQVSTTVGGHTTSIGTLTQSVNGMLGQWSVSIVQDAQGVKKVSGVRLLSDGTSSAFDILADVFRVSLPDGTGSKQAFTLGMLGGVPALGLMGDMYLDGTLHGRALIAESIDAGKIDTRNLTIKDAAGNVIFGAGTNVDLSRINGLGALASKNQVGASDMAVANLSAINANLGTITAGLARNAGGSNFVDFNATGANWFWCANNGTSYVRADGYAVFQNAYVRGDIRATSLTADTVDTENIVGFAVSSMYQAEGMGTCSVSFYSKSSFTALIIGSFSASGGTEGYGSAGASIRLDGGVVMTRTGRLDTANVFTFIFSGNAGTHTVTLDTSGPEGGASGGFQLLVLRR